MQDFATNVENILSEYFNVLLPSGAEGKLFR